MPSLADGLTIARLLVGLSLPLAIGRGGIAPVGLWLIAIGTDFFDGRVARRRGVSSAHGAVLDPIADVTVVLGALGALAAQGRIAWVAPLSVLASVVAYVAATVRASQGTDTVRVARSRVGHAAGVVNYAGVGVLLATVAWPSAAEPLLGTGVCVAIVAANLGAIAERSLRAQLSRRPT